MEKIKTYFVKGTNKNWLVHTYDGRIMYAEEVKRNTVIPEDAKDITLATYRAMVNNKELVK